MGRVGVGRGGVLDETLYCFSDAAPVNGEHLSLRKSENEDEFD